LELKILPSNSIVRFRDGDYNETVYIKGDGNSVLASPEEIISLHRRKFGVDNEVSDVLYSEKDWCGFINLCKNYREDHAAHSLKELQNLDIVTAEGFVKTGFLMFRDGYEGEDSLIHCRDWKGSKKLGTVIDRVYYKGPLSSGLQTALNFIELNTRTGWEKLPNGGRRDIRSYPKEAVREAIVNAIAHRDYSLPGTQIDIDIYSDRIDIVSPGS